MSKKLFYIGSVTYAMKGRKLLEAAGIPTKILHNPPDKMHRGCGYGLEISDAHLMEAAAIFKSAAIRYEVLDSTDE